MVLKPDCFQPRIMQWISRCKIKHDQSRLTMNETRKQWSCCAVSVPLLALALLALSACARAPDGRA